jgi:hypothetical protein
MSDIVRAIIEAESCTSRVEVEGSYILEDAPHARRNEFRSVVFVDHDRKALIIHDIEEAIPLEILDDEFSFAHDEEFSYRYTIDAIFVTDTRRIW